MLDNNATSTILQLLRLRRFLTLPASCRFLTSADVVASVATAATAVAAAAVVVVERTKKSTCQHTMNTRHYYLCCFVRPLPLLFAR